MDEDVKALLARLKALRAEVESSEAYVFRGICGRRIKWPLVAELLHAEAMCYLAEQVEYLRYAIDRRMR